MIFIFGSDISLMKLAHPALSSNVNLIMISSDFYTVQPFRFALLVKYILFPPYFVSSVTLMSHECLISPTKK